MEVTFGGLQAKDRKSASVEQAGCLAREAQRRAASWALLPPPGVAMGGALRPTQQASSRRTQLSRPPAHEKCEAPSTTESWPCGHLWVWVVCGQQQEARAAPFPNLSASQSSARPQLRPLSDAVRCWEADTLRQSESRGSRRAEKTLEKREEKQRRNVLGE